MMASADIREGAALFPGAMTLGKMPPARHADTAADGRR